MLRVERQAGALERRPDTLVDGAKAGEGRIEKTNANTFGIDESADVGTDENTPVVLAYKKRETFTGRIQKVTVETFPAAPKK